jgi:hypothetical protein
MLTRAQRRRIAKVKPPCPLCGVVVGHRNMAELRGFAVHQPCKDRYVRAEQTRRVEQMGLSVVEAGALLGGE